MKKTVVLLILDGWGIGPANESNPIYVAKPENFRWLEANYPVTSLQASGISVGLPWGEIGNSEVGHLTLGAGKVLYQHYPRITLAIRDGSFFKNDALQAAVTHVQKNNSALHFVGLLTKGNVHASLEHLQALLKMADEAHISRVWLHLFADGKDSPPHSIKDFLKAIPREKIATVVGRYYAMNRNQNWQLIRVAYDNMIGEHSDVQDLEKSLEADYARGLSEEFLPPLTVHAEGAIKDNDAIVFFNFREDGMQQLAEVFLEPEFSQFPATRRQNLYVVTMTQYEKKLTAPVAFPPEVVTNPLGKILSDADKSQLRLAETYKYAHVTYFFNGYRETPYKNEYRVLIPSLSTPNEEKHPEMMAPSITERLLQALQNPAFDFILVNYANADTIAHTGNFDAGVEAAHILDRELGTILRVALRPNVVLLVTADHGNLEQMLDPMTGRTQTQHDPSPVPFYLVAEEFKHKKFVNYETLTLETLGILSDVAPTILELLGMPKPPEMTGDSLLGKMV